MSGGQKRGGGGEEIPRSGPGGSCLAAAASCLWHCDSFQVALAELRVSDTAGLLFTHEAHMDGTDAGAKLAQGPEQEQGS